MDYSKVLGPLSCENPKEYLPLRPPCSSKTCSFSGSSDSILPGGPFHGAPLKVPTVPGLCASGAAQDNSPRFEAESCLHSVDLPLVGVPESPKKFRGLPACCQDSPYMGRIWKSLYACTLKPYDLLSRSYSQYCG